MPATSLHPSPAATTTTTASTFSLAPATDRARLLAIAGPLLLFAHGILTWVDGIDGSRGSGPVWAAAGLTLVAAVGALALLTAELGEQTGRGLVATVAVVVAAFGAGAVGAVTLGRMTGILAADLPATLTGGGPVLLAAGLALLLVRLVLVGRLGLGSAALASVGAAVVAVPWDLLPLGALVLLIGFAPLTHRAADPADARVLDAADPAPGPAVAAGAGPAAYDTPRIQPRTRPRGPEWTHHPARVARPPVAPRA